MGRIQEKCAGCVGKIEELISKLTELDENNV